MKWYYTFSKPNNQKIKTFLNLTVTILFVLFIYSSSLYREWQTFDERVIYNEEIFPIPTFFNEILEIVNNFVLNYHLESSNIFFSNISNVRSYPIIGTIYVITSFVLKKHSFYYHLFILFIHILNTAIVWNIYYKILCLLKRSNVTSLQILTTSIFTLIWAIHSINSEAVLLVCNWLPLLTYTFCFLFIYFEISHIQKKGFENSKLRFLLISLIFCIAMFTEHSITLPVVMFFLMFSLAYKHLNEVKTATRCAITISAPYFIGLIIYIFIGFLNKNSALSLLISENTKISLNKIIENNIERIFWLSPQLFVHYLKLIFFPVNLSVYQSNLVNLSNTLFDFNSIACITIFSLFLFLPLVLFYFKRLFFLPLIYSFVFAFLPFIHALSPLYCLSAERYCYFPSFILLLIIFILVINSFPINKKIISFLLIVLLLLTSRTITRIQDWEDSLKLYKSALNTEKKSIYIAQKLFILGDYFKSKNDIKNMKQAYISSIESAIKSIDELKKQKLIYPNEPKTLKIYGLDIDSLILKSAYIICHIKNGIENEDPISNYNFYTKYIKGNLEIANPSELILYADLLKKNNKLTEAKNVIDFGLGKFPLNSALIYYSSDFYMDTVVDLNNAFSILQKADRFYPNQILTLKLLLKYYQKVNSFKDQAKYLYLIGLREHSVESYQESINIYLDLKEFKKAEVVFEKLSNLHVNDPYTILLATRYLDLIGKRENIISLLENAYSLDKSLGRKNIKVSKAILESLININSHIGKADESKKYFEELKNIENK